MPTLGHPCLGIVWLPHWTVCPRRASQGCLGHPHVPSTEWGVFLCRRKVYHPTWAVLFIPSPVVDHAPPLISAVLGLDVRWCLRQPWCLRCCPPSSLWPLSPAGDQQWQHWEGPAGGDAAPEPTTPASTQRLAGHQRRAVQVSRWGLVSFTEESSKK